MTMATVRGRLTVIAVAVVLDTLVSGGAVTTASGDQIPGWVPPVVTVLGYQSLWALASRPEAVLAITSALATVSSVVPKWQPFAGLLVATYAVSSRPRGRHTVGLLAGLGVALLSHSYASARFSAHPASSTATLMALWTALVTGIWLVGVRQRRIAQAASRATAASAAHAEHVLADERLRIARDLHDGVCGSLTAIHLQAAGARAVGTPTPTLAAGSLAAIETSAERSLLELRRVVGDLRSDRPIRARSSPCGPRLEDVADVVTLVQAAGLRVELTQLVDPTAVLDRRTEATVVRVIQEGLTNALKYAPAHAPCTVILTVGAGGAHVQISNPRRPPHSTRPAGPARSLSGGVGLASLRERATLIGGHLTWRVDGDRFTLELAVPRLVGAIP